MPYSPMQIKQEEDGGMATALVGDTDRRAMDPNTCGLDTVPLRVLLVDDDAALRILLAEIITSFACEVTQADNGKSALALFTRTHGAFDLLITDMCMPEMNGRDLVHAIRRRDPELPVIVISGFSDLQLIAEIEACHARLIAKPIDFQALEVCIDSIQRHRIRTNRVGGMAGAAVMGGNIDSV